MKSARVMALAVVWSAAMAACGGEPTPADVCAEDATAECCHDSQCGEAQYCDYEYMCGGGVPWAQPECTSGAGTRTCRDLCQEGELCADPNQTCQLVDHVQGGDSIESFYACF